MRLNVQVQTQRRKSKKNNVRIYEQEKGKKAENYTQVLREVRPWM